MNPPFNLTVHEALAMTAVFVAPMAVSGYIWQRVARRRLHGDSVIPLARRRPVPWQGRDVLLILLICILLFRLAGNIVRRTASGDAAVEAKGNETQLEHPAEQLLQTHNAGMIAVAAITAVIVAPLFEEFFFRLLLQGWLEAVWSRRRRKQPGLRMAPLSWIPILLPAALFALIHFRSGRAPPSPESLVVTFLAQMAAELLTLGAAVALLRYGLGATAADLGWQPRKFFADAKLALWALAATMPPLLALQVSLTAAVERAHVNLAPDPIPLFFLALVFGVLYRRTHRLAPSLVLHVAFNATSVFLLFAGM